jgi:hypothetical protein
MMVAVRRFEYCKTKEKRRDPSITMAVNSLQSYKDFQNALLFLPSLWGCANDPFLVKINSGGV